MLIAKQEVKINRYYFNLLQAFTYYWFKLSDQRMLLGFLWNFLNPLITALILYFIFRNSFGNQNYYYFLYILIGSISWNFLSSAVQASIPVLIARGGLIKNVVFPKEILITAKGGVFLIKHALEIILVVVLVSFSFGLSLPILYLPFIFLTEGLLVLSIALILSLTNVYMRDLEYIWAALVRIGFFLVPIFYQVQDLPKSLQKLVYLNPFTQILIFYRDILIDRRFPKFTSFLEVMIFSVLLIGLSTLVFRRFEKNMAERV